MKFAVVTVALLAAFLALEVATLAKGLDNPGPAMNTITVSGSGDATSTPDIAAFNFSVSADAKAVIDAQTTVTQKTNDILAGLKTLGIEDKDIQTSDYNVYPKYTYQPSICPANSICQPGKQVADGYTVSETISVKVRKTADAGTALALAGEKGATNISSLSLALDDPQAPMNEARLKAIDNAKAKADSLAERLGVRLGRVVSFDDGAAQGPQPIYAAYDKVASQSAGAPPVAVGTNKVSATVNVTYEIR
ncbi:MAG: hypothetical protein JWN50_759 [Parcubacteria group bacterium]|nr:hypothetical protein [Parcubacteria group bacterium]